MDTCNGPGCVNHVVVKSRGLCQSHAIQQRKGQELRPLNPRRSTLLESDWKQCKHSGCTSTVRSLGYCGRHYRQFRRYGKTWGEGSIACSVEGCKRPECARALCEYHYYRAEKSSWRVQGGDSVCLVGPCDRKAGRGHLCSVHKTRRCKYSLSVDELVDLIGDGSCNACGRKKRDDEKRDFSIHHDHNCCNKGPKSYPVSCGRCVVAYLCPGCNVSAGHAGDSAERLRAIAEVIDNPPFRRV